MQKPASKACKSGLQWLTFPMVQWTPYAFVRIAFYFIAGILSAIYFPLRIALEPALLTGFALVALYLAHALLYWRSTRKFNPGWSGLLTVALMGYLTVTQRSEIDRSDHLIHNSDTIQYYRAVITSYPGEGPKTWKQIAEVKGIRISRGWLPASGKVLLYINREAYPLPFGYGDILLVKGNPQLIPRPANPHEFDYGRFLSLRYIVHQHYLQKDAAIRTGNKPSNAIMALSMATRTRAVAIFQRYIPGDQEQGVASALVLGDKGGLDDNLYDAFAASGTMHVLAVSGLHVGIIYAMMMFLLRPARRFLGKWGLALISILTLWTYAFVTGLSPSVLRATTMFTFVAFAGPWARRTNIYNTLAVSAFALLLIEPNLILSVSFQLSYAAVLGIVYFYPRLAPAWQPDSWIAVRVWQMSCVSIAAQLATFPIASYYFHQFPLYFLIANLLAIPLSFAILVTGIGLLASALWTPLAWAMGHLLSYLILTLNKIVAITADLPFSTIDDLYITPLQCWMLIGLAGAGILLCELRQFRVMYLAVFFSLAFGFDQWIREFRDSRKNKVVVYQLSGHFGMDLIHNGTSYFFADSLLAKDAKSIDYHITANRMASGVREICNGQDQPFARELGGARLIRWKEYTIIHIFSNDFKWPAALPVDCAIVSNNALRTLGKPEVDVHLPQLVVDGSNSAYVTRRLEEEAARRAIAFHATREAGAYEKEI